MVLNGGLSLRTPFQRARVSSLPELLHLLVDMENRIGQPDLFSDGPRLMSSTAISCVCGSLPLLAFSANACVAFLHQTELATAAGLGTIRPRLLLKIGAQIRLVCDGTTLYLLCHQPRSLIRARTPD